MFIAIYTFHTFHKHEVMINTQQVCVCVCTFRCVRITDTGLGYLSTMSSLRSLYLRWCCQVDHTYTRIHAPKYS